jgi:hypothetical protein
VLVNFTMPPVENRNDFFFSPFISDQDPAGSSL